MADRGNLQTLIKKVQPKYDTATIIMQLNSNLSHQPFVLVEGAWDCKLFRKLLDGKQVNLGIAEERGKGGCHYVEQVVKNVLSLKPKAKVIGIRDKDYTNFDTTYQKPQNIFLTDEHSLETMLLHSQNVWCALERQWPGVSTCLKQVLQDARHISRYYVFSILENLNVDFHESNLHLSSFIDIPNKCMQTDWKERLRTIFFAQDVCKGKDETYLERKLVSANFYNKIDYDVCRGHDLLHTCYSMMSHGSFTIDYVMQVMVQAYSSADFAETNLCKQLDDWAKGVSVSLCKDYRGN